MPPPSIFKIAKHTLGHALIETGQALDRVALRALNYSNNVSKTSSIMANAGKIKPNHPREHLNFLKGKEYAFLFELPISKHKTLVGTVQSGIPTIESKDGVLAITEGTTNFIAPCSSVVGDVKIGRGSSIWYGAVVRGDQFNRNIDISGPIVDYKTGVVIGEGSNIQDNAVVSNDLVNGLGVCIGKGCTIGHNAMIIGADIGDYVLVGMGSKILAGSKVGSQVFIAANTVITPQSGPIPSQTLWAGNPARKIRDLDDKTLKQLEHQSSEYVKLSQRHLGCMEIGGGSPSTTMTTMTTTNDLGLDLGHGTEGGVGLGVVDYRKEGKTDYKRDGITDNSSSTTTIEK
jgi:carbonic anhydrase/acetyltransferase-like protein (isoleucine patch superfamily)